jgi:hypothetical protein
VQSVFDASMSGATKGTVRLDNLAEVVSGVAKGRKLQAGYREVPYLRVANVQAGRLDLTEIKTIPATEREVEELALKPGDVLLTEGGDSDKLGRGAIWRGELPLCIHQNHVFRVRPHQGMLDSHFFASFLLMPEAKAYFLRCAKKTSNLASINMRQLRALPVPDLSLAVQARVSDAVAELYSLTQMTEEAGRAFQAMNASLVMHAFRGDLTFRWRRERETVLASEAKDRDSVLKAASRSISDKLPLEQTLAAEVDRRRRDISREQRHLLKAIEASWKPKDPETWVFTHETLAESLESPLSGNPDTIRRHLEVFAARGLIIPISREVELSDGTTEWRVAYRRPHAKTDDGPPEDAIRLQELANLAKQIKELQK